MAAIDPNLIQDKSDSRPPAWALGCLGGLAVGVGMWFLWWQLLSKIWADCQPARGTELGLAVLFGSPFVVLSAAFAFALPIMLVGRAAPRTAALLGLALALLVTYFWFIRLLPPPYDPPSANLGNACGPSLLPPWWPWWLPI